MRETRPCPICQFVNLKDSKRCLKCGAALGNVDVSDLLDPRRRGSGRKAGLAERLRMRVRAMKPRGRGQPDEGVQVGWEEKQGEDGGGGTRPLREESGPVPPPEEDYVDRPGRDFDSRYLAPLRRLFNRLLWGSGRRDWEEARPGDLPSRHRSAWAAGLLAFLPGGGGMYNRRPLRAGFFAAVSVGLLVAFAFTFHLPASNWILLGWMGWLLASFVDGMATAARDNGQLWTPRQSLALFFYALFWAGAFTFLAPFVLSPVVKCVRVRDEVLEPTIAAGDKILVSAAAYWFRRPRRGEVVFYNPPAYQMDKPGELENTTYIVNEDRTFERVNGVEGDVVERRGGGPLLLNGEPMPEAWYPMAPQGLPGSFRIEVPPGKVCALISHYSKDTFMAVGSFGGVSPYPNAEGYVLIGWEKACLVSTKEMYGRAVGVYNPPRHRKWLTGKAEGGAGAGE